MLSFPARTAFQFRDVLRCMAELSLSCFFNRGIARFIRDHRSSRASGVLLERLGVGAQAGKLNLTLFAAMPAWSYKL
jgi:hypothetical protein